MIIGVISGYYNPVQIGHIEQIKDAKKYCDYLICIVNNDRQVGLKGSCPFMNQDERVKIMERIKGVDSVFLSIDEDRTVCESLRFLKPQVFLKGGDRNSSEIPEASVCKELGIRIIDGVGGDFKMQSSSSLIENAAKWFINKKEKFI